MKKLIIGWVALAIVVLVGINIHNAYEDKCNKMTLQELVDKKVAVEYEDCHAVITDVELEAFDRPFVRFEVRDENDEVIMYHHTSIEWMHDLYAQ